MKIRKYCEGNRQVELASDPEKITRKLKFNPDVPNTIRNYKKINKKSPHAAGEKRLKFIIAVSSKISQF